MRGVFANLLVLMGLNLAVSLMVSELESDRIIKENILEAIRRKRAELRLVNAEEELWRVAELSGKQGLNTTQSFTTWLDSFPQVRVSLRGVRNKPEVGVYSESVSPEQLSKRIIPLPELNKTTTTSPIGFSNEKIILEYYNQSRTIYLGGKSWYGEERNWTIH